MVSITREVMNVLKEEAFEIKGVTKYFELLYHSSSSNNRIDTKNILDEFQIVGNQCKFNYETVAKKYKIIDDNTKSIVINCYVKTEPLVAELRQHKFERATLRKLQQYAVSVYKYEYEKLVAENAIEVLDNGYSILNNQQYYKENTGFDIFTDNNKNAECNLI
jgi:CRISPR-associated endonuclease/helicase Cas3